VHDGLTGFFTLPREKELHLYNASHDPLVRPFLHHLCPRPVKFWKRQHSAGATGTRAHQPSPQDDAPAVTKRSGMNDATLFLICGLGMLFMAVIFAGGAYESTRTR